MDEHRWRDSLHPDREFVARSHAWGSRSPCGRGSSREDLHPIVGREILRLASGIEDLEALVLQQREVIGAVLRAAMAAGHGCSLQSAILEIIKPWISANPDPSTLVEELQLLRAFASATRKLEGLSVWGEDDAAETARREAAEAWAALARFHDSTRPADSSVRASKED